MFKAFSPSLNPTVASDIKSHVDWRAVATAIQREPEVPLYPVWARVLIFIGLGLGVWAMVIGCIAFVQAVRP